jgi:hypothetical protein
MIAALMGITRRQAVVLGRWMGSTAGPLLVMWLLATAASADRPSWNA